MVSSGGGMLYVCGLLSAAYIIGVRWYMERDQFEAHVLKAVEELPEEFKRSLKTWISWCRDWPDREQMRSVGLRSRYQLLGLL
jgi:predicted Zn-dependent protease with MMP-like domain